MMIEKYIKPFIFAFGLKTVPPRCTLTLEQIEKVSALPIVYPNAIKEGDDRLFIWDGERVHVNKTKFVEISTTYNKNYLDLTKRYERLTEIMNSERIVGCPHCHLYDQLSAVVQGVEHARAGCHVGHYKKFVNEYSFLSYENLHRIEMEKTRVENMYRQQNVELKKHSDFFAVGSFLQSYSAYLWRDLRIQRITQEEIDEIIEKVT